MCSARDTSAATARPVGDPRASGQSRLLAAIVAAAAKAADARFAVLVRLPASAEGPLTVVESCCIDRDSVRLLENLPALPAWLSLSIRWATSDVAAEAPALARLGLTRCTAWSTTRAGTNGHLLLLGDPGVDGDQHEARVRPLALTAGTLVAGDGVSTPLIRAMDAAAGGITLAAARAPDMPLVYVNERFCSMTGYSPDEVIGRNCRFLQGDEGDQEAVREIHAALAAGRDCEVLLRNYRRDGSPFWNELRLAAIAGEDGEPEWYIGIQHDVTEREELLTAVEHERGEFRRVLRESPDGMMVLDDEGQVQFVNPVAATMLGRPGEDLEGEPFGIPLEHGELQTELTISRTREEGGGPGMAELSVTRTEWNGSPAWLAVLHDVTARRHAEDRARHMAYTDTLTGLANRDRLREDLEAAIAGAGESGDRVGMLLLDMDRFKEINDSLGHAEGDRFLVEVARRLQESLRDNDLIARFGGDEFAVLLERVADEESALRVAEKIVEGFHEPLQVGDRRIKTACSLGISLFPDDADTATNMMKHADAAMYAAKRAGGAGFQVFRSDFAERAERRLEVDQVLSHALAEQQFEIHYQPQVTLGEPPRISGLEALVRWNHPERGVVGPGEFIEDLEELDLIGDLTRYVLAQVCGQIAAWSTDTRTPSSLRNISVNLSARELRSENLAPTLEAIIEQQGIDPGWICFEVTESAAASDIVQATHTLGALRALGARIALDDFGKGYSALNYLRVLPIDTVKIDREFVRELPGDESSTAMIRAIVEMAHGIHKQVLAEGVETPGQHRLLAEIGCDFAQGFLYGRPVPVADLPLDDEIVVKTDDAP